MKIRFMMAQSPRTDQASRGLLTRWVCWFLFGTSLLLMGLLLGYVRVMPRPGELLGQVFLALSVTGHGLSLGFVPALVTVPLALVFPRRGLVLPATAALACLVVVLVWVDAAVFRLYRFHLNGMVWELLTGGAVGDVLPITGATWIQAGLEVFGLIALELALAFLVWLLLRRGALGRGVWVTIVALAVAGSGQVLHAWADAQGYAPITRQVRYLPGYYPLTAKRFLRKRGFSVSPQTAWADMARPSSGLSYPRTPLQFDGRGSGNNLVIIISENLRYDFLSPKSTPNLWRFSQRSLVFDHHLSSGNCTRFGVFGLFYGIHGPYFHAVLAENRPPLLMDAVVDHGYQLAVFSSASLTSPEFDRTVFARVRDRIPLITDGADTAVGRDGIITTRFKRFLDSRDPERPFFGFLFYDAPHSYSYPEDMSVPFQPSLPKINHLALDEGFDPLPYKNRLLNSIHFVDGQIGEVLEHLESQGLLDRTIVVVTGDHGQEFNENGLNYWGHNGNFSRYQTQVTMLIHWPGRKPEHIAHRTHHVDLAPTILTDLFGCTTDVREYSNGRHLLDSGERTFVVVSNWNSYGVVQGDRIDVVQPTGDVDTFHADYREWRDAPLRTEVMMGVLEDLSRFYAREEVGQEPTPAWIGTEQAASMSTLSRMTR